MKKIIAAAASLTAIAALAVPSLASAAAPTPLSGDYGATTIQGNAVVKAGTSATLNGTEVTGIVTVESGATLRTFGATFDGNLNVNGGNYQNANWPVTVKGNVNFTNPVGANGFWVDSGHGQNHLLSNLTWTLTQDYPQYYAPSLYFGDGPATPTSGTEVDGNITYNTGGRIYSMTAPFWGYPAPPSGALSQATGGHLSIS